MGGAFFRIITALIVSVASTVVAQEVFISEIHYDNSGGDSGEAIEITGPAGTSLDGWSVPLYNGKGGGVYSTVSLSGVIPDQESGFGALWFTEADIQNGADGLALTDGSNSVLQFLSYEGRITASNGPADGLTSTDIGVTETKSTLYGTSLQLVGSGSTYSDFTWISGAPESFGQINAGMYFDGQCIFGADGEGCATTVESSYTETPDDVEVSTSGQEGAPAVNVPPGGLCEQTATSISAVQGTGTGTPLAGNIVTVRGIATAVFPRLSGLFIQDSGDGNSATSDGIFVYLGEVPAVSVGDEIAAIGNATDMFLNTQITVDNVASDLAVCSSGNTLPDPVEITLPSDESTLESLEGMFVSIKSPVVTDNYNAGTYGEITVAAERLWQFTQVNKPGSPATLSSGTTIIIDDGATGRFPNPDIYVDQASVIRVGQSLNDVQGIVNEAFGSHRLQPTSTLSVAVSTNPRPVSIPERRGNVRVASFNVLNYFTTLNSRGAKTVQQREDQLAKITKGALALNADVIAIIEVENDYDSATPSIQVIVDSINARASEAAWRYVVPSTIPLGSDEIAVGIIYDSNKITSKGDSDVLDYGDGKTRASLAQTLEVNCDNSECPAFTLVTNHLKSKGSDCESIGDPDAGDGQGNCNGTRTKAMIKLLDWLSGTTISISRDPDIVLAGDFNAYAMEDPIQTAIKAGYVDLSSSDPSFPRVSSYVFKGESGTLDYLLASSSAASQRLGECVHYNVNADETAALEYDSCGTNAACTVSLDQYRCSDHDMAVQDFLLV